MEEFNVINRKGETVPLDFNRILTRLESLKNYEPKLHVNVGLIAQNTIKLMINNITTIELDNISANICASMITTHPDYGILASRIEVSNLHKETKENYYEMLLDLENYYDDNGIKIDIVDPKLINFAKCYSNDIQSIINYSRDYNFTYFGIKTLKKSYLLKHNNKKLKILERPQHLFLRVAIGINFNKINSDGSTDNETLNSIFNTYELMSQQYYIHATPTLFNAGTLRQSLSSCFLLSIEDDLSGIYKTLSDTAKISKWSGGIGVHCSQVRAKNSLIKSTNGKSEGIIPMLKVYNDSALYVSQGGGKRKGSTAVYLEPWHSDIFEFLDLKKPIGDEYLRARDLFLALWIPDLFMKRLILAIESKQTVYWSLFCPNIAKELPDKYGDEFEKLYLKYENEKKYNSQIDITILWKKILEIQMESGVPYIMFKDHINRKCNQNNLGTIKSSNLCVHGNTLILTDWGYFPIKKLVNQEVNVWNGTEFSPSMVAKTNSNQELLQVTTSDGCKLLCTPYHKFHIYNFKDNNYISKEAKNLKKNDVLISYKFPVIEGDRTYNIKHPYTLGFYCGNSMKLKYQNKEIIYYNDYDLHFSNKFYFMESCKKFSKIVFKPYNSKFYVPINANMNNRLKWLAGFIDGNCKNDLIEKHKILEFKASNYNFIYKIKLLCNTLGVNPCILKVLNNLYILQFNESETYKLFHEFYVPTNKVNPQFTTKPFQNLNEYITISSVKQASGLHDTYCFNEPRKHQGILNGMLTGNCAEINIYTDKDNIGVCNLASICLPKYINYNNGNPSFDYQLLYQNTKIIVKNLNQVIDNNVYPVSEGQYADYMNRPLGIGVQGLADVFFKFKIPFTSAYAKNINKKIFETIYYGALESSCELAQINGPYKNYSTSMIANGKLQFDLWNVTPSTLWDWDSLRNKIKEHGVYNSLLTALMPTASTSQIMGNYEMFEPITSNMFVRNTLSGTYQIINKYLIKDLIELNIWNDTLKQKIIANNGSIQNIPEIPNNLKEIYSTIWELKQKDLIDMDADRSAYISQSSSSNRYIKNPTNNKLTSMYIYCWKKGLKTGCYYLRTQSGADAVKFTVDVDIMNQTKKNNNVVCTEDVCTICSA
jgi:ribonucleoside-diphosphate reductase alpha chain